MHRGTMNCLYWVLAGYEVTVERPGFQTETRKGITLVVGQRASVDFVLRVAK